MVQACRASLRSSGTPDQGVTFQSRTMSVLPSSATSWGVSATCCCGYSVSVRPQLYRPALLPGSACGGACQDHICLQGLPSGFITAPHSVSALWRDGAGASVPAATSNGRLPENTQVCVRQ